jgi:hypothetical protein
MGGIVRTLFVRRSDAPWQGYVPVLLVIGFFTLLGLDDEGVVGMLPYIILLVIAALQLYYRTLAGWLLLFACCLGYGTLILVSGDRNAIGEWLFFAACGFVPAIALFFARPRGITSSGWI